MILRGFPILLALWAGFWTTATHGSERPADSPGTARAVAILQTRCVGCHGPEKQKGDLRLDSRDRALHGGGLGPALVPGDPSASLLIQSIRHLRADLEMPPKDPLTGGEIEVLERWVRDGAPWTHPPPSGDAGSSSAENGRVGDAWSDPNNPITRIFHGQRLDLWSLRPLQPTPPPGPSPKPGGSGSGLPDPGARHPVDRFIRQRLAKAGIESAPPAPPRIQARRAAFDLTGLPPHPDELRRFLGDTQPGAWERYVDRLLASPAYGEHQARLWLDVIRYADSNGFDWDEFRPDAWRFRDYVIRAFNADKPFDEFIREQLAGDERLDGPPRDESERDSLIATGYLRLGPQDNSAPLFNEQARARAEWMADLTETTASAFLAVTMNCCRCHDHKFDPVSQADHFRLRAFFEPLRRGDDLSLDLAQDHEAIVAQREEVARRIEPRTAERDRILDRARRRLVADRFSRLSPQEQELVQPTTRVFPEETVPMAEAAARQLAPREDAVRKAFTTEERARTEALAAEIAQWQASRRTFTRGLLATDSTDPIPTTRILFQGDPKAERDAVPPGFLSALDPNPADVRPARNPRTTGRRLALAEWIASPANPLTARVYVNRVWQSLFGRGLVATPNDFGLAGARPTHPELLDWLAQDFLRSGWSTKHLLRRLVTSATYRMSTVHPGASGTPARIDRDNALLWRQNLRRLSAEQLRDALLATSGLLRTTAGGPAIWPELPAEVLQANPAFLDDNAEKTKGWYPSPLPDRTVRSVFLVQKRTVRVPFLETFDLPDNGNSCPRRAESIVAPQALSLLNGPEGLQAARALAERVARDAGPDPIRQTQRLFELSLQRQPDPQETESCRALLRGQGLVQVARALINLNEFAFID